MTKVVIAVAAHESEPAVDATVTSLRRAAERVDADIEIAICINGDDPSRSPAARSVERLDQRPTVVLLDRPSKPAAWDELRKLPADVTVFADADVIIDEGSIAALVAALAAPDADVAAAVERPLAADTVAGRIAALPHRLEWSGVSGRLYAARTATLPQRMPPVLLDDAWLFAQYGPARVKRVPEAVAYFRLPRTWGDLWRQRVRAEAGKSELRRLGLEFAPAPEALSPTGVLRSYRGRDLPLVGVLSGLKLAARAWGRIRKPEWGMAPSTKT
jgi:hypothetical protein